MRDGVVQVILGSLHGARRRAFDIFPCSPFVIVIVIVIVIACDHEQLEVVSSGSRGSAPESAASLDVLRSKGRCSEVALIKANSDFRLHDGN